MTKVLFSAVLLTAIIPAACTEPAQTGISAPTATPQQVATAPANPSRFNPRSEPATPIPLPLPTPIAVQEPTATMGPVATPAPEPMATATPSPTPIPAPAPTAVPTLTPTVAPTEVPRPISAPTAAAPPTATDSPTATSVPEVTAGTWRGITIASENRCSPCDSGDYRYSPSVELRIVEEQGGIFSPYTGAWFEDIGETDIEHIVVRSEAHDSGLCAAPRRPGGSSPRTC